MIVQQVSSSELNKVAQLKTKYHEILEARIVDSLGQQLGLES